MVVANLNAFVRNRVFQHIKKRKRIASNNDGNEYQNPIKLKHKSQISHNIRNCQSTSCANGRLLRVVINIRYC